MRITAAELAALKRKREQPVKQPGETLAIFVAGKLANPLNGTPWIWQKRTRYAKAWKERVADALFVDAYRGQGVVGVNMGWALLMLEQEPAKPKRVTFTASTWSKMDSDGLQAAMKPIRDALVVCRVISGDADRDGHEFVYDQRIDRVHRGVEIRVRPREDLHATS